MVSKKVLLLSFLAFCCLSLGLAQTEEFDKMIDSECQKTVPFIQPQALFSKLEKGNSLVLLDTRNKKEFTVSRIKGARQVGFMRIKESDLEGIEKSQEIIVYCTVGVRSENFGEKLVENGFTNVHNLYGGIINWVNQGYPVLDNTGKETNKVHVYSKEWGKWLQKGTAVY